MEITLLCVHILIYLYISIYIDMHLVMAHLEHIPSSKLLLILTSFVPSPQWIFRYPMMMVVVIYSFNKRHVWCQIPLNVLNICPCLPIRAINTNIWVLGDRHVPVKKRRKIYYFGRFMNFPMTLDNCQCSYTFSIHTLIWSTSYL